MATQTVAEQPLPSLCDDSAVKVAAREPEAAAALGKVARVEAETAFECNVCLELASEPVVTLCGHLYCWPCLYRWMALNADCKTCPVCKAGVDEDKVVPLYGRGSSHGDPRKVPVEGLVVPNRPVAQRPSVGPGFMGQAHLGYGLPSMFGLPGAGMHTDLLLGESHHSPEQQQQAFLSRLLLMLGSFVIMCLLLF